MELESLNPANEKMSVYKHVKQIPWISPVPGRWGLLGAADGQLLA